MKTIVYSHRSGLSIIQKNQLDEIFFILSSIEPIVEKNSVTEIRTKIIDDLSKYGWSGEYRLDPTSKITITSSLNKVGLCLQTGNISRVYADLLKLQALFLKGNINVGVIVLPQKELAHRLASNMANYERLIGELPIFQQVISMPLVIVGFNTED